MTQPDARDMISVITEITDERDRRLILKRVAWRDLVAMRPIDGLVECLHPLPWVVASWAFAAHALWVPAMLCAFMIFLTALRLNHEAIHHNLGFGPRGHRMVLHVLSAVMLGSNAAVAWNHLHHHRHVGRPDDLEGKAGTMPGWRVLLYGPVFPIEMHLAAWRGGGRTLRRRMTIDLALSLIVIGVTIATGSAVLAFHVAMMALAQCLTAFFAVWITHHGCEANGAIARTQRSALVNLLTYNMFFHLEHHLFPAVPVKRLNRLAERLDRAAPDVAATARHVVPNPFA
ncbi:fatty acid desaturase family protein [Sphingomonas sp. RS2018]